MTINEMRASSDVYLLAADVAEVLHVDAQSIRNQARFNPESLGFPVIVIGTRVRIPRVPFLQYLGVKE